MSSRSQEGSQCCHSWKVKNSKRAENEFLDSRRSLKIRKDWAVTIAGGIPM